MRIEQLTFTRFLAAISIVIFHYGKEITLFNNDYVSFIFEQANIGVSYFFILSGFVMIIAYHNRKNISFLNYLKDRLARIYPVYFFAIILMVILSYLHKSTDLLGIFLNIFLIQAWFPEKVYTINGPGWSLSVELLFYIIFPFLFNYIYKKVDFKIIVIPIILIWLVSQLVSDIFFQHSYTKIINLSVNQDLCYFPLLHINEFLIGNLAGLYFVSNYNKFKRNTDLHILFILILILIVLKMPTYFYPNNGFFALFFVPLILFISSNKGIFTRFFNNRLCVFLGEISFGIYILQKPVWKWLSDYGMINYLHLDLVANKNFVFFIRFFVLIMLSSLSYVYFEKPMRKKIQSIF